MGLVVLLDRLLDKDRGLDRLVRRAEERHEPVAEGLGLDGACDFQPGADQVVVRADDLVGGSVANPDPEVGRALQIREQDREGPLNSGCLRLAHRVGTLPVAVGVGAAGWSRRSTK